MDGQWNGEDVSDIKFVVDNGIFEISFIKGCKVQCEEIDARSANCSCFYAGPTVSLWQEDDFDRSHAVIGTTRGVAFYPKDKEEAIALYKRVSSVVSEYYTY